MRALYAYFADRPLKEIPHIEVILEYLKLAAFMPGSTSMSILVPFAVSLFDRIAWDLDSEDFLNLGI